MSISNIENPGPGRPKTHATPIMVRMSPVLISALDEFIASQDDKPSRPEAVRRILSASILKE